MAHCGALVVRSHCQWFFPLTLLPPKHSPPPKKTQKTKVTHWMEQLTEFKISLKWMQKSERLKQLGSPNPEADDYSLNSSKMLKAVIMIYGR